MQLYVPLNTPLHPRAARGDFALAVGQLIERAPPEAGHDDHAQGRCAAERSSSTGARTRRHKTTICAYSLRARPHPTVSTPVSWDEVEACAKGKDPLVFEAADVLERVDDVGDLFRRSSS